MYNRKETPYRVNVPTWTVSEGNWVKIRLTTVYLRYKKNIIYVARTLRGFDCRLTGWHCYEIKLPPFSYYLTERRLSCVLKLMTAACLKEYNPKHYNMKQDI